ncbi:hypothetical protein FOL47_003785 [Perkinsus chesapeaki]|uniref:Uncharacterized protein n=1 Tax=Perkinsus chesapeaki TaxID=330153 RepID=A0A7J6M6E2_PERCH|nr:hypothetical protein FOL47_003785 [Perkinsus chesapeaki]
MPMEKETVNERETTSLRSNMMPMEKETVDESETTTLRSNMMPMEKETVNERETTSLRSNMMPMEKETVDESETTTLSSNMMPMERETVDESETAEIPEGIFDCNLPPSKGTLNFVKDTKTFHINMTILECDFKVADVPYTALPTEKWATTMRANYTGTSLDEQVRNCNKPDMIASNDFVSMLYLHDLGVSDTIQIYPASGMWYGAFTKRR